jgi:hypothetical protein
MARQARIHYPGGVYHLISRCVGKQFLLGGRAERSKYFEQTEGRQNEEAASRSGKMIWTKNLNQKEPLHEKEILYWP